MTFFASLGRGLQALWSRLNPQQRMGLWLALIASGGPLAKLLSVYIGVSSMLVTDILSWLNYITPIIAGGAYIGTQTDAAKVRGIESLPTEKKVEALQSAPDDVKVKVANAVDGVETVIISDTANGSLGDLARSDAYPNIVTAADAKEGMKA